MNNYNDKSNISTNKLGGLNFIIIGIITFLYILLITKLAEIISINSDTEIEENKISLYVMIVYFISIIGIIFGYVWFSNTKNKHNETPNWIIRWSLSIGGILMLIHTIINYWEYLNDYCKILLIFLSITSIIYYLYKYY